jgi:aminoglycoside 3-N-acetyltransferase
LHFHSKRYLGYCFPIATAQAGKAFRALRGKRAAPRRDPARALELKRQFGEFSSGELCRFLHDWGIGSGETLMVHSSLDAMPHLTGTPIELIKSLQTMVGSKGTLCMPTFPAIGPEYPQRVFDVQRTPSTTGLLTELFRRCPDVVRSMQLRSVAACGQQAKWLVADHHLSPYPSGIQSPYYRVAEANGKFLTLGLSPVMATAFHCAEDVLEGHFPSPIYEDDLFEFDARDADGETRIVQACKLKLRYGYVRDGTRILPYFSEDIIQVRTFHGVPCALIDANPFVERLLDLAKQGIHMYGFRFPRIAQTQAVQGAFAPSRIAEQRGTADQPT